MPALQWCENGPWRPDEAAGIQREAVRLREVALRIYCAGPLFSQAERDFLARCAGRFRDLGFDCFVPHEQEGRVEPTPESIFALDFEALRGADALFAWLDGPQVDDGTACEVGLFLGLMHEPGSRRKGIVGLATDLRVERRRALWDHGGMNLFLVGAIRRAGRVCWSLDEVVEQLLAWRREGPEGRPTS